MQRVLLVWLIAFGAWSAAAWSQRQITEEEFLSHLSLEHAALAQEAAAIGSATADRQRVAAIANPKLGFVREDSGETAYESVLSLAWTAPLDGRRGLGVEAAEAAVAAAEARQRAALLEARATMRQTYATWVLATQRHDLLEANLGRLEEVVGSIAARSEKGEASKLAAGRVELSALEVRNLLGLVGAERARALAGVRLWDPSIDAADRPIGPHLVAMSELPTVGERADLQALSLDLEQTLLEEKRSRRFVTFPELLVGWKQIGARGMDLDGPVFGLNWDIPIGDRRLGDRIEAESQREAAQGTLDFTTARAQAELVAALGAYDELLRAWMASHAVIESGDWMAEAAVARYRSGEDTLTDLLDTLRSVLLAQLADTAMYARTLEAHRTLELAIGRPVSSAAALGSAAAESDATGGTS